MHIYDKVTTHLICKGIVIKDLNIKKTGQTWLNYVKCKMQMNTYIYKYMKKPVCAVSIVNV